MTDYAVSRRGGGNMAKTYKVLLHLTEVQIEVLLDVLGAVGGQLRRTNPRVAQEILLILRQVQNVADQADQLDRKDRV